LESRPFSHQLVPVNISQNQFSEVLIDIQSSNMAANGEAANHDEVGQ
jgi:hypothetical protein